MQLRCKFQTAPSVRLGTACPRVRLSPVKRRELSQSAMLLGTSRSHLILVWNSWLCCSCRPCCWGHCNSSSRGGSSTRTEQQQWQRAPCSSSTACLYPRRRDTP